MEAHRHRRLTSSVGILKTNIKLALGREEIQDHKNDSGVTYSMTSTVLEGLRFQRMEKFI